MSRPIGPVEYSNAASMNAYRSLAAFTGRDLFDVLAYARRDRLGDLLVENRVMSGGTTHRGGLDGPTAYQILLRRRLLWALRDRAMPIGG